jgi:hypothetical protein
LTFSHVAVSGARGRIVDMVKDQREALGLD